MAFGTASAIRPTDAQRSVPYTCNGPPTQPYLRLCLSVDAGSSGTTTPRRLASGNQYMSYELYTDAARTQPIGPSLEQTWTARLPADQGPYTWTQLSGTLHLYGRVFAGQGHLPSGFYQEGGLSARLSYAFGSTAYPATCTSGTTNGQSVATFDVNASIPYTCRITALSDLDFGSLPPPLSTARDQAASISLQCPQGASWKIGMGPGEHRSSTRRMSNGTGGYVAYELYRDAARTQIWGNQPDSDTVNGSGSSSTIQVPIYGRIPGQGAVPAGTYNDTVIITLTY